MNKEVKQHKEEYYHIPKGEIKFIFISLLLLILLIGSIYVTYHSWIFLGLEDLSCSEEMCNYEIQQLLILPLLILDYIIISLTIINFISIFKKLKSYSKIVLISGLIYGLIGGLIYGLIYGLIGGLIYGLIGGLISGLIYGLIIELTGETK